MNTLRSCFLFAFAIFFVGLSDVYSVEPKPFHDVIMHVHTKPLPELQGMLKLHHDKELQELKEKHSHETNHLHAQLTKEVMEHVQKKHPTTTQVQIVEKHKQIIDSAEQRHKNEETILKQKHQIELHNLEKLHGEINKGSPLHYGLSGYGAVGHR